MVTTEKKPSVGVAFTGYGIYGLANVALVELFEEMKFRPDVVLGNGTGAVIAGMWGKGLSASEIIKYLKHDITENMLKKMDVYAFLSFFKTLGQYKKDHALLKPTRIQHMYNKLFHDTKLEDLKPRTLIQVTDVDSGAGKVFSEGLLSDLVYASGAMLPFLPPILINNNWYTDGNFSAPIPVMELVNQGMDHILSLSFSGQALETPSNFLSYYSNFVNLAFSKAQKAQILLAIEMHHGELLVLPVKIRTIEDILDAAEIQRVIDVGRETVQNNRAAIRDLLSKGSSLDT